MLNGVTLALNTELNVNMQHSIKKLTLMEKKKIEFMVKFMLFRLIALLKYLRCVVLHEAANGERG